MFDQLVIQAPEMGGCGNREAIDVFKDLERLHRQAYVAQVQAIGYVDRMQLYEVDGHRTVEAWTRALGRWPTGEARNATRVAVLLHEHDDVRLAAERGAIGVAQLQAMARANANPRCGDRFGEVTEILLDAAGRMSYAHFRLAVQRWELLADPDGAHRDHEEAHANRRATADVVDGVLVIHATGTGLQAAEILEIFERETEAQFRADCAAAKAEHGDETNSTHLPRTAAQRRFDALHSIFVKAASTPPGSNPPEPTLNIWCPLEQWEDAVRRALRHARRRP